MTKKREKCRYRGMMQHWGAYKGRIFLKFENGCEKVKNLGKIWVNG